MRAPSDQHHRESPSGARARAGAARPVRDGILLGLAVGVSGLAFGAAAVSAGLSTWQACALSLLAYTGASQFALVGVIGGGGSLIAGSVGAILLGARNGLYGMRLAGLLRVRGPARLITALGVTDESTAIALAQQDQATARTGFRATFVTLYLTWNLATLAGALSAGTIGSPQSFGLDVIGPAAFLALIWPRLRSSGTDRAVALLGAALALAATPLLPPGAPIIVAAGAAIAGSVATRGAARQMLTSAQGGDGPSDAAVQAPPGPQERPDHGAEAAEQAAQ
ncbi:MAG TPA: AzlC family ABC transporter permease [Streptosporangiaceae bacterium]